MNLEVFIANADLIHQLHKKIFGNKKKINNKKTKRFATRIFIGNMWKIF